MNFKKFIFKYYSMDFDKVVPKQQNPNSSNHESGFYFISSKKKNITI
jgi:hypothetical protein